MKEQLELELETVDYTAIREELERNGQLSLNLE